MNRVAEPFQSLLNDIREATQTLANCAARGKLNPDGTRQMPVKYIKDIHLTFEQPRLVVPHEGDDAAPAPRPCDPR